MSSVTWTGKKVFISVFISYHDLMTEHKLTWDYIWEVTETAGISTTRSNHALSKQLVVPVEKGCKVMEIGFEGFSVRNKWRR